ncbi:unnamed protein product [Paramecium pentaurelia]|uniref:Uncharacterized protein n=1 Tax=Paramecium pentaurelia TaxID=43138 RepID=A0A8S1XAX4_9CILI|nr:unnamed protein product [Paramecium pentaurelia]
MFNINCPQQNHQSKVDFFCINPFCKDPRFFCFEQCFQVNSLHQHDRKHINKIELLPDYLIDFSYQFNSLEQELKQLIQLIMELFHQLQNQIQKRFQWNLKKLMDLGGKQIEIVLSNMINFNDFQRRLLEKINNSSDQLIENLRSQIQELEVDDMKVQKYEFLRSVHLQENKSQCKIISFNQDSSIIAMDVSNRIKIYGFNKGQLQLVHVIDLFEINQINYLKFFQSSDEFLLGSEFGDIMLWKKNERQQFSYQFIRRRNIWEFISSSPQYNLLINDQEDLIVQSKDNSLKLYEKQQEWNCTQTIINQSKIMSYCLNQSSNMLISSCQDNVVIYLKQKKQVWKQIQTIDLDQWGYRICFVDDNHFAFQPRCKDYLQIYGLNDQSKMFELKKNVQVKSASNVCHNYFPLQFIKNKNIIINKNGRYINIIKISPEGDCETLQFIKFGDQLIYGTITNDGEYLITWDNKSTELQIRQFQE